MKAYALTAAAGALALAGCATSTDEVRWGPPRTPMTMEFKQGRVTVAYDDAMNITAVTCG